MQLKKRINAFKKLGNRINFEEEELVNTLNSAVLHNGWFTPHNVKTAFKALKNNYLNTTKLNEFCNQYGIPEVNESPKTIGLVMAGNIPLVGFQDLLYILLSGNKVQVKLSSKDEFLSQFVINQILDIEPLFKNFISVQERLKDFDAIIATGSNNTSRYFEYYFSKYPNILRRNRNSIAILNGKESNEELTNLSKDVFNYYGLGCRNVSKVLVPESYDFPRLLSIFEAADPEIKHHHKYKNNYDYQLSLLLINNTPHLASENLLLKEEEAQVASPISCLHFQHYKNEAFIHNYIKTNESAIQCVVSNTGFNIDSVEFGKSQSPTLFDFADNIDVMNFLLNLESEVS